MKGFAATPVIFIAVFLITVMLFVHFMDIDKQVAEGVGKEARLRKLQADALKNATSEANELHSCALSWARIAKNEGELKNGINSCANVTGTNVRSYTNGFSAEYTAEYAPSQLIDASLNKTLTISERLNYPFFELSGAVSGYNCPSIYNSSCTVMENKVNSCLSANFPTISWNKEYGTCSGWKKSLYLTENWMANTLSEEYPHYANIAAGSCDC